MHHERDPAHVPELNPQGEGVPTFTLEQLQAVAQMVQMAQTMGTLSSQPGMNLPAMPGGVALPGQVQVLGVTDMQALIDEFLDNQEARGRSPETLINYQRVLSRLIEVCPKLPVTAAHVRQTIMKETWDQSTRFVMYSYLRAFLNELEKLYGIPNDACKMVGKVDRGSPKRRFLSMKEVKAVYKAATVTTKRPQYHRFTLRNQAIVLLMLECGPRLKEIANIRRQDVTDGWVCLNGKTGAHWVPVSRELTDRTKALGQGDVIWVNYLGNPMSHRDIDYLVSGLQEKAGITGKRLGVHLMRHSFATNYLLEGGGVVFLQRIMGHTSIATTMRYVKLAGVDVKLDQSRTSLARRLGIIGK